MTSRDSELWDAEAEAFDDEPDAFANINTRDELAGLEKPT